MAEVGVMKKLTIGGSTYTIPEYELPIASASTLGGIKVGTGLTINSTTGVLSATGASFDETDPIFTASPAAGITQNDIDSWDAKVSDDKTWNSVTLNKTSSAGYSGYVPFLLDTTSTTASLRGMSDTPSSGRIAVYNSSNYLISTTPTATDNSTKVATTAFVKSAIPTNVSAFTNDSGYLTSYTETDPIFVASAAHGITSSDISNWNSKTDTKVKLTEKTSSDSGQYPLIFGPDSDDIVSGTAYEGGYSDLCWEPDMHILKSNSGLIIQTGLETQISMHPAGNMVARFNSDGYMALGAANDNLGRLRFYNNTNNYYSVVSAANITANRTLAIPNKDGTIAITSDIPTTIQSATTGITASTTATKTTLGTATSVTGVQSTTTTASKVTVGSHSTDYGVKSAGSGSFTQGSFSGGSFTQGTDSFTANTPTVIDTTKFNGGSYSHTGFSGGSGSFTQGTFTGGSLVVTSHVLSFTPATHGADSHTHTAATYGTDNFTAASLSTGFYTAGIAASFTQGEDSFTPATHGADSHTHTAPTLGSKVPTVSASDVTVPIKNSSSTSIPNVSVTSATVTITDTGHTHTLS